MSSYAPTMDYRLHQPGGFFDGRMDFHNPYEHMRMQHHMFHHAPPALYPQFRQTAPEPMPRFDTRQEASDSEIVSQTVEGKKRLIIFPRRKAGQKERDINNVAPVHLTLETIEEIADVPLLVAAKQLGISKTALKNACRHLGLERWPFRRRMQNARLQSKAAEKAASQLHEAAVMATSERRSAAPARPAPGAETVAVKEEISDSECESPADCVHPAAPRQREEEQEQERRLNAVYSALTTPNASTASSSSDDQNSPINALPARPTLSSEAWPRGAFQYVTPGLRNGWGRRREEWRQDEEWSGHGASPHVEGAGRRGVSPLCEDMHGAGAFSLRLPPGDDHDGGLERGMNRAVHAPEAACRDSKEAELGCQWGLEEETHAIWEDAEGSYSLPALYHQPMGH